MLHSAETPAVLPTPPEEIAAALERIVALHGLPLEDRLWLARHGQELHAQAGDVLFDEGAPAERMMLILKGEIHVRRQKGGSVALFLGRAGQMTGLLPFSRMTRHGGQGFAITPVWALLIHKTIFDEMLAAIPSMAQRVVSTLLDRVREVTRIEQQAEKLTALGKLAGNLAHELKNPASAAQRVASSLAAELRANRENRFKLVRLCPNEEQIAAIEAWEKGILDRGAPTPPTAGEFIAREEALRGELERLGCTAVWEVAVQLAEQGVTRDDLAALGGFLHPDEACVLLQLFARSLRFSRSVETMLHSTERIFDLISAIQIYSSMDRAPVLEVNVPAALDATLQMFQSRMGEIELERAYQANLPCISAYARELNQVWTALIENALDALGQRGRLRLSCQLEGEMLMVEVWNSGPGIPAELQSRVFEPFFTTKPQGQGLGLGLDTALRVVRMHRGHLSVRSEPGSTSFSVHLPLDQLQAY
jgi:signal transduction histidine kinase